MTTRRFSSLLEQEEAGADAAAASSVGVGGGGGPGGFAQAAAPGSSDVVGSSPGGACCGGGSGSGGSGSGSGDVEEQPSFDGEGAPPSKLARGWSSTTQTTPARPLVPPDGGVSRAGSSETAGPGAQLSRADSLASTASSSAASCAGPAGDAASALSAARTQLLQFPSGGVDDTPTIPPPAAAPFPLPSDIWAHALSFLPLRALPITTLLDLLAIGATARVRRLDLSRRRLGATGGRLLAERFREGACPDLEEVRPCVCTCVYMCVHVWMQHRLLADGTPCCAVLCCSAPRIIDALHQLTNTHPQNNKPPHSST